jgi:NADH-quinone oxidoreductase subunit G
MIDTRDDVVVRIRPRPNLDVNRHFICDTGRMNYRWMNRGDRVEAPLVRQGGRLQATDWDSALDRTAELLRAASGRVVILASGRASTEALGWAMRLVEGNDVLAAVKVPFGDEAPLPGVPNLALRRERAPNGDGARLLGYTASWGQSVSACSGAALVLVLDADLDDAEAAQVARANAVVGFLTVDDERFAGAEVVLPVTTMAEENGTFVNRDGRVQRYMQARPAPGMARPIWWAAANVWERGGTGRAAPATPADAFARLSERVPALGGVSWAELGLTGRVLDGAFTSAAS